MQGMFSGNRGAGDDLPPAPSYDAPVQQTRLKPAPSMIGPDIAITGSVTATADLQIDGKIDGDVRCGGLTQGPDGRIKGNVVAENARLGGTIEGSVTVRNLTIAASAKILGDVAYETISIENGAHIDGRLKYTPAGTVPAAGSAAASPAPVREETVRLVSDGGAAA